MKLEAGGLKDDHDVTELYDLLTGRRRERPAIWQG